MSQNSLKVSERYVVQALEAGKKSGLMPDSPLYVGLVTPFASVADNIADLLEASLGEKMQRTSFATSAFDSDLADASAVNLITDAARSAGIKVCLVTDVCTQAQLAHVKSQANSLVVYIDSKNLEDSEQPPYSKRNTALAPHECDLVLVKNVGGAKATAGALSEMIRQRL